MSVQPVREETMIINMGPQHPSTHGVLRLVLELDGEYVVSCRPVLGYLHTGIEMITGLRMNHAYVRVGGVSMDLPDGATEKIRDFLELMPRRIHEYEGLLS